MTNSTKQQASDKIINRIRALLAMGADTSSENEAAIALKRARKLMDEHQVSLSDVEAMTEDDLGSADYDVGSSKQKLWVGSIALKIAEMNDCIVRIASRRRGENIRYQFDGFKEDAKMCEFMLVYLVDTCNRLYLRDKGKLNLKGAGDKNDFLTGMAQGLSKRMDEIIEQRKKAMSEACDGRSLMVMKAAIVEKAHGKQKTSKRKTYSYRETNEKAYYGGSKASKEVHLGTFVDNNVEARKMLA